MTNSVRKKKACLTLCMSRKLLVRIKSLVGWVVGNLLGRSVGFVLGHNLKGFCLGQFIPKTQI
jgi:hypothetical protein